MTLSVDYVRAHLRNGTKPSFKVRVPSNVNHFLKLEIKAQFLYQSFRFHGQSLPLDPQMKSYYLLSLERWSCPNMTPLFCPSRPHLLRPRKPATEMDLTKITPYCFCHVPHSLIRPSSRLLLCQG